MSLFNLENNNNNTGYYPLFLGEPLGLFDSFNSSHPKLYELHLEHLKLDWKAEDQNFAQDCLQMASCDERAKWIMTETLGYQLAMDSILTVSLGQLLDPIVTSPEYSEYLSFKKYNESVHARTYARIIQTCYKDSNEVYNSIKRNAEAMKRIVNIFLPELEKQKVMVAKYSIDPKLVDIDQLKIQTLKTMGTLHLIEGGSFNISFASTWSIPEAFNIFNGIAKSVSNIANDELGIHKIEDQYVIKTLIEKEGYSKYWDEVAPFLQNLYNRSVEHEFQWADYLLGNNKNILGFNSDSLKEYGLFCMTPLFDFLGLESQYGTVKENPFNWIDKWVKLDNKRQALQETSGNNYMKLNFANDWDWIGS